MSEVKLTAEVLAELRRKRPGLPLRWLLAAAVAAVGLGAVMGPTTVTPTEVGNVTHWGGWALETAFLGVVLVASAITFRIVEILFRAEDAHALRMLPLSGQAVAADRLRLAFKEAGLGALLVMLLVAMPLAGSPAPYAAVTAAFLAAAALVVPMAGFGVIVSAMAATVDPTTVAARLTGGTVDGRGAVHHLSPGAAFGTIAGLLLLLKLGFEEPLRVYAETGSLAVTNAMLVGVGLPLAAAFGTLVVGMLGFGKNYHEIQASLFDAEVPPPDTGYDYFGNTEKSAWVERFLRPSAAAFYRKDSLQAARSAPFLFPSTIVIAVIGGFALWASEFLPPFGVGLLLGLWLVLIVAPLRRMRSLPGEVEFGLADMLASTPDRETARRAAATVLAARHALPLAVAGIGAGLAFAEAATPIAAALLASVLIHISGATVRVGLLLFAGLAVVGGSAVGNPVAIAGVCGAYLLVAIALFRVRIISFGSPETQ